MNRVFAILLLSILFVPLAGMAADKNKSTATALDAGDCAALVQVTDSHDNPVTGATVTLWGKAAKSTFRLTEKSDQDGRVRFAGLPKGQMKLSAKAHGRAASKTVDTSSECDSKVVAVTIPD